MKYYISIIIITLLISCQKEEKQEQLFPNYTKSLGLYELPDWLKGDWETGSKEGEDMYLDESIIRKENTEVWIQKTNTFLEIIYKDTQFDEIIINDPAVTNKESRYIKKVYEKTDSGIRYYSIYIDKNGKCLLSSCEPLWKYYKRKK